MDWNILLGGLGVIIATSGLVYGFLRNFKEDIHEEICALQKRQEIFDERLFKLALGYSLERIMKEERERDSPKTAASDHC